MKASAKQTTRVTLSCKKSGADVMTEAFKYSKTIGQVVASKLGLSGDEASAKAKQMQRTLRRVRVALENAELVD